MFEKLSNNLNLLMADARLNASELARKTGVPASTIKKIRNGDNPNPTLTTLIPIAQNFSVSLSELVGDAELPRHETKRCAYLPLLNWTTVAEWPCAHHTISTMINEYSADSFALVIPDDHWDGFPKDSLMIVDPAVTPTHRHFVLVHKDGSATPAIRQMIHDDGLIYLKPIITGFEVSPLTPKHRIIGTVVEIRKQLATTN